MPGAQLIEYIVNALGVPSAFPKFDSEVPTFLLATLMMALYKMLPIKLKLVWGGLPLLLQHKIEKKKHTHAQT
jgi:hypothetical protein